MAGPGVAGVLVAPVAGVVSAPVGPAFRRAPVVWAALVGLAAVVASGVPAGPAALAAGVVSAPVGPAFRRAPVVSPAPVVLVAPAAPVGRRGGAVRGPLPVARGRRSGRGR
ncbi:hypothetical protein ACI2L4_03955 [Streptomyces sparsogenes]|uniref:hypothetical protein n=1 Tax=Streptomyces sparsogenes TaxID=67365 RepID=UPI003850CC86